MVEKIDNVKELTVGSYYLVPCIQAPEKMMGNFQKGDWIPVIGAIHSDPSLGAPFLHYHYDRRFIRQADFFPGAAIAVAWRDGSHFPTAETPIEYQRKRCYRKTIGLPDDFGKMSRTALEPQFAKCKIDIACPRCPHQGIPLNAIDAQNGIITCPGHGLKWSTTTGELITH